MVRPMVAILVAVCTVGCQQGQPLPDPFLPQTVPPPATGSVAPGARPPYYSPSSPGGAAYAPPTYSPPQNVPSQVPGNGYPGQAAPSNSPTSLYPPPTNGAPYVPPGGWQSSPPQGSGLRQSWNGDGSPASTKLQPALFEKQIDDENRTDQAQGDVIRIVEPSTISPGTPLVLDEGSFRTPTMPAPGSRAMSLTEIDALASQKELATSTRPFARQVSLGKGPRSSSLPSPNSAPNSGSMDAQADLAWGNQPSANEANTQGSERGDRFGHADDYSSLRGQLQYSQTSRQWKLRYIPIDGKTDKFGGSVVLPDSDLLEGFAAGEFVEIRGKVLGKRGKELGFAPTFRLKGIRRQ